jgi:small subunit ribosomal protein S29
VCVQDFLKSHREILESIPCRIFDSIPLGEGPGIGLVSGPQEVNLKSNATLKDLIQLGLDIPHASVGVVVRLRKELSLVEEVPVLIAVDEVCHFLCLIILRDFKLY